MSAFYLRNIFGDTEGTWQLNFTEWPAAQAQRLRVVLAESESGALAMLADRPCDQMQVEYVESLLKRPVQWRECDTSALDDYLERANASVRALPSLVSGVLPALADESIEEITALQLNDEPSPVVRLINGTLHDALLDRASDIHIECVPGGARIRFRIDGVMAAMQTIDGRAFAEQVISRLKVMSELDIGERRLPQDGRFRLRVQARVVDFRLSILPSSHGEDAVVRVLDPGRLGIERGVLSLEALGFDDLDRASLNRLALLPHGMLLVTGPTGSGKTTTLYAMIGALPVEAEKIITIEDPVEYRLDGAVQIPVNEKKGLTFARGLRSILRHDPDRVMVGEIRDAETAQIAVQAALTGHLVFSTVHANHVFDVIGRFMHMGLDMYSAVSALNAVVAQRLIRIICTQCAYPDPQNEAVWRSLGARTDIGGAQFMRGRGCTYCRGTGYRGRRAISELLVLDDELRDMISAREPMGRIKQAAHQKGLIPLRSKALDWAYRGITTLDEVVRVTLGV